MIAFAPATKLSPFSQILRAPLKILWPGPILFFACWFALQAGGTRFLRDPGTFWHITTGEKILNGEFLNTDPYTFSFDGEPWIPYQWLGEAPMALLHRVGGFDSILAASTALTAFLLAWLGTKFIRTGLHPVFALAIVLTGAAVMAHHFHARPLLFTMLALAGLMQILVKFENSELSLVKLAWLIPLFAIWTNIHGGMLGGLTTLGLAGIGWTAFRMLGWNSPLKSWKSILALGLIGIACGLTAFVSPYGVELPKTWMLIMNMPHLPDLIVEHSRFNVLDPKGWPTLATAGLYLAMLAGTLPRKPKVTWLLPLFWLLQAMLRVRHGSLFAIVAVVSMIDIWPHTLYARWLALKRPDIYVPKLSKPGSFGSILFPFTLGLGFVLVAQSLHLAVPLFGAGSAKFDPTLWPEELKTTIQKYEPRRDEPNKIFCEYIYGGYLIYHAPGYRVFVDDRCEVFGDAWLKEFIEADGPGAAEAIERWQANPRYGQFQFALTTTTDRDDGYDAYFRTSPKWELIEKTDTASFYKRKSSVQKP